VIREQSITLRGNIITDQGIHKGCIQVEEGMIEDVGDIKQKDEISGRWGFIYCSRIYWSAHAWYSILSSLIMVRKIFQKYAGFCPIWSYRVFTNSSTKAFGRRCRFPFKTCQYNNWRYRNIGIPPGRSVSEINRSNCLLMPYQDRIYPGLNLWFRQRSLIR